MSKILVIGAGRSASSLIEFLLQNSKKYNLEVTISDMDRQLAQSKTKNFPDTRLAQLDVNNSELRRKLIGEHDIIISMLPAFMHLEVAKDCIALKKHLATASYVSEDLKNLENEIKANNLCFINEAGLDPGIDHASAMKIIDHVKANGGKITQFKSYCGGLVAPESNDNPWGYKFSWNPRNVVLAGQGTAQYLENGKIKFIPYNRLFTQTDTISIAGYGNFDAYANRDSLSYIPVYGLKDVQTMLRGTLRMPGYCKAWHVFVKLGLTDDTYKINHNGNFSYSDFIEAYLPAGKQDIKTRLLQFMGNDFGKTEIEKLEWLGLFSDEKIKLNHVSPAVILQDLLERKWVLKEHDKDMIVMQHLFEIESENKNLPKKIISSLVVKGDDQVHTAMAKTVGIPLGICVKNLAIGKIKSTGIVIPTTREIYEPLLTELEEYQIRFNEEELF